MTIKRLIELLQAVTDTGAIDEDSELYVEVSADGINEETCVVEEFSVFCDNTVHLRVLNENDLK